MPRPPKEPPVATTLLPAVLRLLGEAIAEDEIALPLSAIEERLQEAAEALGEPSLGLSLPRRLAFPRYGYGELAARASKDVGEALARLARFVSLAVPGATATVDRGAFSVRFPPRARKPSRVLHEWALAHALEALRAESGAFLVPERVWFVHARPRDLGPVHVFFGTREIDFGREDDGLVLAEGDLARPLARHDPRLVATMDALAERAAEAHGTTSWAERVARAIPLPDGRIESVAAALHASPRTVQRRLEAEGTRYSEVLDRARAGRARSLLRDSDATLYDIAVQLGFSEVASFTRAFKRWTGVPPGTFRRRGP